MLSNQTVQNTFQGDGVTTVFNWSFDLPVNPVSSFIQVWVIDNASPPNKTLLASNYSANLATKQVSYPLAPGVAPLLPGVAYLPVGWQIVIARVLPLTQLLSLTDNGTNSMVSVMGALDYAMMVAQQITATIAGYIPAVATNPSNTYAGLKALAAVSPGVQFFAYATDLQRVYFYCANPAVGDGGFIPQGGG